MRNVLFSLTVAAALFVPSAFAADSVAIVRAVLSLADALGMSTTAEGIESRELAMTLAALGCAHGQGFHYAKPLRADEALAFWQASQRPQ